MKADLTIEAGASLSNAIDLNDTKYQGTQSAAVAMPAEWTEANLTFLGSVDGSSYLPIYDGEGNEYTVAAAASRYIFLEPAVFRSITYLKIRSGTASSSVAQLAARTISLQLSN